MSSGRTHPVPAIAGILLRSIFQCRWLLPFQRRCHRACFVFSAASASPSKQTLLRPLGLSAEQSTKIYSPGLLIKSHYIRFATGDLHFIERAQAAALDDSFACTLSQSIPLWRFIFFSKRICSVCSSSCCFYPLIIFCCWSYSYNCFKS